MENNNILKLELEENNKTLEFFKELLKKEKLKTE
jgi:hypothetical protein